METGWNTDPTEPADAAEPAGPGHTGASVRPTDTQPTDTHPEDSSSGALTGTATVAAGEEETHRAALDEVDELLDEVELALTRLDDGTYGRCEECGEPIDADRLAERPVIRTCGRCRPEDAEAQAGAWVPAGATDGSAPETSPA